jgi:hypothetical protein
MSHFQDVLEHSGLVSFALTACNLYVISNFEGPICKSEVFILAS